MSWYGFASLFLLPPLRFFAQTMHPACRCASCLRAGEHCVRQSQEVDRLRPLLFSRIQRQATYNKGRCTSTEASHESGTKVCQQIKKGNEPFSPPAIVGRFRCQHPPPSLHVRLLAKLGHSRNVEARSALVATSTRPSITHSSKRKPKTPAPA